MTLLNSEVDERGRLTVSAKANAAHACGFRFASACLCVAVVFSTFGNAYAGVLIGNVAQQKIDNLNLTSSSIAEWAIWGQGTSTSLSPTNRSLGSSGISNLTGITNGYNSLRGLGQFGNYGGTSFQWSNGSPTGSASSVYAGLQYNSQSYTGVGEGFSLTTLADTQTRTVNVYSTVHVGTMRMTASLSDSSAAPLVIDSTGYGNNFAHTYSFTYSANSAGQTLTLDLRLLSGGSNANVAIQGVTLSPATGGFAAVPEPGTSAFAMLLTGGTALSLWRKKRRKNTREVLAA